MSEAEALLVAEIERQGFAFAHGAELRAVIERHGTLADWDRFAASWDALGLDTYMADGGRYRKRRHAVYAVTPNDPEARRAPHQPHYQSRDYNPLHGGIERWFEPIAPAAGEGDSMVAILRTCRALFERLSPTRAWHIEVHQFRIEARPGEPGQPTPEGMHRDGVDFVLVLLVRRQNVRSGVTSIRAPDGRTLGSFTLAEPMDAALVNDLRVMHGVTAVEPVDPTQPASRDVLVVTFRQAP
ncbi:MAG: 2OG-Fe dioxygenase family protein [Acetobacteraceae bacterium]|nr:2OG-Fe dioxygenase family protein [Acetobacteraceae bacterium]